MMRTFIAIDVNDEVRRRTNEIVEKLVKRRFKATWVKPENVHLTLFFLDEISKEKAEQISERLKRRLLGFPSFSFIVERMGYFKGRNGKPRVVWLGVKYDQALKRLYSEILNELEKFSFQFPQDFKPHITIGRVKMVPEKWELLLSDISYDPIVVPVDCVVVYSSTLTPSGPIYSVFRKIKFEGGI